MLNYIFYINLGNSHILKLPYNVTKCLDWIFAYRKNLKDRDIILDTNALKNLHRFIVH